VENFYKLRRGMLDEKIGVIEAPYSIVWVGELE